MRHPTFETRGLAVVVLCTLVLPALAADRPWFGLDLPDERAARSARLREAYGRPDIGPLSLQLQDDADPYMAVRGADVYEFVQDIVDLTRASRPPGAQYWGRIAGSDSERFAAAYVSRKFRAFGLHDVRTETVVGGPQWLPISWQVTLRGHPDYGSGTNDLVLESAFPALHIGEGPLDVSGLEAQLVFVGRGHSIDLMGRDVRGKIAVVRSVLQPDPFFQSARGHIAALVEAGAVGVLTWLDTPGNHKYALEGLGSTGAPCFVLGGDDGRFVEAAMLAAADGVPIKARLDIRTEVRKTWEGENVVGLITGETDENVVILAHLDGYFEAANDNAGGLAAMLALAKFFADPARRRPKRNFVFLATSAHHERSDGARSFIESHPDVLDKTLLAFNIEHPSSIMSTYRGPLKFERFTLPGQLMTSTSQGTRGWTVSNESEVLIHIVREAVDRYGLVVNSMMERLPTGDAFDFFRAGTPVVQMLDANLWFHSDGDLSETIHPHGLERATRAYAYILDRIDQTSTVEIATRKSPNR